MAEGTESSTASATAQISAVLDKILPFARLADALARRSVAKIRTLALLGFVSALGLTVACAETFSWGSSAAVSMLAVLLVPAAVLWKLYGVLKTNVGLPQRIVDTVSKTYGKAIECRTYYVERTNAGAATLDNAVANSSKPRFRELWKTARTLLDLKSLSDEAREVASIAGGAVVLANPAFAILMFAASAVSILLSVIASLVGLAYIL